MKKTIYVPLLSLVALAALVYLSTSAKEHLRSEPQNYQVPDVTLRNQKNEPVPLPAYLACNKPVLLEFIFTSCTTLCPSLSVSFANFQKRLAPDPSQVRLVSITVDPETDTPEVIRDYLKRYQAQPGWDFLTGRREDIKRVMAAFDIKAADMITLQASLILRSPKTSQWRRVDGRLNVDDIMREYQRLER